MDPGCEEWEGVLVGQQHDELGVEAGQQKVGAAHQIQGSGRQMVRLDEENPQDVWEFPAQPSTLETQGSTSQELLK